MKTSLVSPGELLKSAILVSSILFFISVFVRHSQTKISKAELQTYKKCSYHLGTKTAIRVLVQMIPL